MTEYLPIGSVVTLKNGRSKLMIIGYCKCIKIASIQKDDYVACIYPIGLVNYKVTLSFKHEQIDEVVFMGKTGKEYENMCKMLR